MSETTFTASLLNTGGAATNFSAALDYLKRGLRICRSGWNGKGMWLVLIAARDYYVSMPPAPGARLLPWIAMKTADGGFVPWLASQTDLLAEDWQVVA